MTDNSLVGVESRHAGGALPRRAAPRLLAIAAAFAASLLCAAGLARADVLVGNAAQGYSGRVSGGLALDLAQGFTTGNDSAGYTLSAIALRFANASPAAAPTVTVHTGTPIGTTVATLSGPSEVGAGMATFRAPANTTLTAATVYFVRVEGGGRVELALTRGREDPGAALGWRIHDTRHYRFAHSTGSFDTVEGSVHAMTVNGTEKAAPEAANATVRTDEDTPYTFRAGDFNFSGGELSRVTVAAPPARGTLALDGVAVTANLSVSKVDIDANRLVFTPAANGNGAAYASFIFRVSDGDQGSASAYTMAIDVAPVNDPATGKPTVSGTAEVGDTLSASTSAIVDVDGLPGTFAYRWMRVDGATETVISGATRPRYVLTSADQGKQVKVEASFTDRDGTRESMTSDATATVAAGTRPTASHGTVTTDEDTAYTFQASDFSFSGVNAGDALASVKVVTLPSTGTLTLNGTAVTPNQSVSKADLDAGKLDFTPAANANGDGYASFTFRVSDGTNESASAYTMTIDVTPVNDALTGYLGIAGTAKVGQTLTADVSGIHDPDRRSGRWAYRWVVNLEPAIVVDTESTNTFRLDASHRGATVGLSVQLISAEGITGSVVSNPIGPVVSDAKPKASNATATTDEDTAYVFQAEDFGFVVVDAGDTLSSVRIVTLSSAGTLALDGTRVWTNQSVTKADIDASKLVFTPAENANGAAHASFAFRVNDGTSDSASTYTMTIDVDAAPDPPTAYDVWVTTAEDTVYTFRADDFGYTDVDAGDSLASVKVVTLPSTGALTLDGTEVTANQSVTKANIDAGDLVFTPVENANGDDYAYFTFKVSNGTEESLERYFMSINVMPVNDPATGTPSISGREEVDHTLSADTSGLADIDGLPDSLVYRWVRIDGATETTIAGATNSTYRLVDADLGKTLKVEVSFTDGDGTAESATSDATGTVGANASPKAADATVTVKEDTTYTFRAGDFNFSGAAGRTLASVRIVTLPSVGLLLFHGEPVTEGQSVTKADIDITKLYFNPVANANGAAHASFTFKVSDGTEETAAYTMTIDVTPESDPATGTPTVTGKAQVGHTLVADIADIADVDGLPAQLGYQWRRVDGTTETDIAGATSPAYTLTSSDEGKKLKVTVSFTDEGGAAESVTSGATAAVGTTTGSTCSAPTFTNRRAIWTGTVTVGNYVQTYYGYYPPVGFGALDNTRFRLDGSSFNIASVLLFRGSISFALNTSIDLSLASELVLHVCDKPFRFDEFNQPSRTYNWSNSGLDWSSVAERTLYLSVPVDAFPPKGIPAIWGDAEVGRELFAWTGDIADGNEVSSGFAYQWIRVDGTTETDIEGATSNGYTLTSDDLGKRIRVKVSLSNTAGTRETVTSLATGMVQASTASGCGAPSFGDRRVIWSGTLFVLLIHEAQQGCRDATYEPSRFPVAVPYPSPHRATPAYVVVTSSDLDTSRNKASVSGLSWISRLFVEDWSGLYAGYNTEGTVEDFGGLTDARFSIGSTDYTIGWFSLHGQVHSELGRNLNIALLPIPSSAHEAAFTVYVCDKEFRFATSSERTGDGFAPPRYEWADSGLNWSDGNRRKLYLSVPANSEATGAPAISGPAQVGETLTASTSDIADADGLPDSFAYQWVRVDADETQADIEGATDASYALAADDLGQTVKVRVTFTDTLDGEESLTSDAWPSSGAIVRPTVCQAPDFAASGRRPVWTGTLTVGRYVAELWDPDLRERADETVGYGFKTDDTGALAPDGFTLGSNGYAIGEAFVFTSDHPTVPLTIGYDAGHLLLSLEEGLSAAEREALTLHVCARPFALKDAAYEVPGAKMHDYTWSASELDWSGAPQRTLYLSVPQTPGALSVADAAVDEGPGATLDFAVTLSGPSGEAVTVDYATSDGTATAGSDYTATSGTLTFASGETGKTVSVPVLDDAHDDGGETLTFTLSNAQGATIDDAEATGTIDNTDAMPKAWLARFGRTVASQVLDAVESRLEASRAPGAEVSVAGQRLGGGATLEEAARRGAEARLETLSNWLGNDDDDAHGNRFETRGVSGRELLTGSSFALTGGSAETGFGALWGRGAVSRFDGREGELTLDGEVTSAMLGADFTRGRATAGLVLSHSRGEGGYRSPAGGGAVESSVTGLYPWGSYALSERLSVWAVAGYGEGTLALTPEGAGRIETDMALAMGALGLRGVLIEAPEEGGVELSVKTDAMGVRTTSEAARGEDGGNLAGADAKVTRLRLGLEATWHGVAAGGGVLTPSVELGVRHDGGDAETGYGADIGARLAWSHPERGLSAEVRARGLLAHEADGFSERGFSGTLSFDPEPDSERGLSFALTQTVGASASGGADALLGRGHLEGLAANDDGEGLGQRRLEARLGYGFALFGGRFTGTPEIGLGLSDAHRDYSLGWRLAEARPAGLAFGLDVEGGRRERASGDGRPEHRLGLGLAWRLEGAGTARFEVRFEGARLEAANDNAEHRLGARLIVGW